MKTRKAKDLVIARLAAHATDVCNLARKGNKYALRQLARVAVELTECMDDLMKKEAPAHNSALACWQPIFAGLPYLPVLKHRHGGDLREIQKRIDLLHVGIKLSFAKNEAKFDPNTPINAYVRKCLIHIHQVQDYITSRLKTNRKEGRDKTPEEALARCTKVKRDFGWIDANEVPVHLLAYMLPPLAKSKASTGQKSLADKWAREVLIPLIRLREPSLEHFAHRMGWTIRSGRVESDVCNKVAQCLETIAANSTDLPAS